MSLASTKIYHNRTRIKKANNHARSKCITVHDWASYHESDVVDDGTQSFFWRAHTLTVLFVFTCFLLYVAIKDANYNEYYENLPTSPLIREKNIKRGISACVGAFILFGIIQTPDGPFKRPHPVVWRFVFCVSVLYELLLIFLFFQTPSDARAILKHIDPELGIPLPEKSYGGNCQIYDPTNYPDDPFYNLKDKMDEFVPTHFLGWWFKTLILRDWWLCTVMSVMFEILEYTLEHQLPNFSECWWDHWILDVIICNGAGIYLGMKTLNYLSMKPYHWSGLWNIPGYKGKLKRVAAQFSPYSWIRFEWRSTATLKRWLASLGLIFIFLLAELNTFYLKYVLWLKPTHYLNLVRLIFFLLAGGVSMRETFQYMDDPRCKKFGRQAWVVGSIIVTELLVIYKFDPGLVTKPLPPKVSAAWALALFFLVIYTFLKFFVITPPIFRTLLKSPIFTNPSSTFSTNQTAAFPNSPADAALASTVSDYPITTYYTNHSIQTNFQSPTNSYHTYYQDENEQEDDEREDAKPSEKKSSLLFPGNVIEYARKGLEFCDKILGPSQNIIVDRSNNNQRRFTDSQHHHYHHQRSSTIYKKSGSNGIGNLEQMRTNNIDQSETNANESCGRRRRRQPFHSAEEELSLLVGNQSPSPPIMMVRSSPTTNESKLDAVFNSLLDNCSKNYFYLNEYTSADSSASSSSSSAPTTTNTSFSTEESEGEQEKTSKTFDNNNNSSSLRNGTTKKKRTRF